MRISDWSSDVCSSDLVPPNDGRAGAGGRERRRRRADAHRARGEEPRRARIAPGPASDQPAARAGRQAAIPNPEFDGRAISRRERGRSEERRVGKEGVSTGSIRGSPEHEKKKKKRR